MVPKGAQQPVPSPQPPTLCPVPPLPTPKARCRDHGLHGCHQALALIHGGQPKPGGHPGGPRWGIEAQLWGFSDHMQVPGTHPCPAPPGTHLGHKLLVLLVQVGRGGHVVPPDPQLALLGEPGGVGGRHPVTPGQGSPAGGRGHRAQSCHLYSIPKRISKRPRASPRHSLPVPRLGDTRDTRWTWMGMGPAPPCARWQPRAHLSAARSLSAPRV